MRQPTVLNDRRSITLTIMVDKIIGKQRPRANTRGRYVQIYTPRETLEYEELIARAFKQTYGYQFADFKGEVHLHVTVWRELAKSNPKRMVGTPDVGRPDGDNILKLIMDALNRVAYMDDCQITCASIRKRPRVPHATGNAISIRLDYL